MLEKDIENLLASYPDEFFPNSGFNLIGQQVRLGKYYADIIFTDKYLRKIIVEVKRGILSRDAVGQIIDYYGLIKEQEPKQSIELILCANTIPPERRKFLENTGIDCKELDISLLEKIAKKHNYKFLDESKVETNKEINHKDNIVELNKSKDFRQATTNDAFSNNKKYLKNLFSKLNYGNIQTDNDNRLSIQHNSNNIMSLLRPNNLILHKVPLGTNGTGIRKTHGREFAKIHPFDANNKTHVKLLEELFEKYYVT